MYLNRHVPVHTTDFHIASYVSKLCDVTLLNVLQHSYPKKVTIKRQISACDLFMRIMQVKCRSHKFVPHKFLSGHMLQCIER